MGAKGNDGNAAANRQRFYWDAIKRGDSNRLASLIEAGVDLSAQGPSGCPPLIEAVLRGRTACAQLLLALPGVDPSATGHNGWTALDWAIERDNMDVAKALLAMAGFSIDDDGEGALLLKRLLVEREGGGGPWTKHVSQALRAGVERRALAEALALDGSEKAPIQQLDAPKRIGFRL